MKTTGNTILITGATSGIGRGLALRFHAAGNRVVACGRRRELLDELAAEHDGITGLELDVADPASIAAAHEAVVRDHPDVNVVVNMAGIMRPEDLHDGGFLTTSEQIIATNLLGSIRVIAAFTPLLTAKPDGVIMNVSSGLAFVPLPLTATYCATKAAMHSFSESLRVQLADTPLQVLELVPPAVQTDLMGLADSPRAMPLEAYLDEVMGLLDSQPDAHEILVEDVKPLRFAEVNGAYDQVLAGLSASH